MADKTGADLAEIQAEYRRVNRQFQITLLAAVVIIAVGAAVYRHLMHLSWVNAFYFCTVTLATVGYGDIVPKTDAAKVFTIFYILTGIGIITTFAGLLIRNSGIRRELKHARKRAKHTAPEGSNRLV